LPEFGVWAGSLAATLLLFVATFFLSQKFLAIAYFVRAVLAVHATALLYFLIWPSRFPHTPNSYLDALIASGIEIITIVPLLFALIYYILDFGLLKKTFLTLLTMMHLSLFLPVQVLSSPGASEKCSVYAGALHRLRNAAPGAAYHRVLLVGNDVGDPPARRAEKVSPASTSQHAAPVTAPASKSDIVLTSARSSSLVGELRGGRFP